MRKLIVGNWKSHKHQDAAIQWVREFNRNWQSSALEVVIAPPFTALTTVKSVLDELNRNDIELAVQDLSPFPAGAYTGVVSSENLKGLSVNYAILGHSERRRYFHETHVEVANKVDQALQAGITPIVCVDDEYIQAQAGALASDQVSRCVVAYEPLEAIGNGLSQPVAEVIPVVKQIKQYFGNAPIIYGGSVEAHNVAKYLDVTDGVLVGTKSLDVHDFLKLLTAAL